MPFGVIERTLGAADVPVRNDAVDALANSTVTVWVPPTAIADVGGRTVSRCHIPDHEDQGMMRVIRAR